MTDFAKGVPGVAVLHWLCALLALPHTHVRMGNVRVTDWIHRSVSISTVLFIQV